MSDLGDADLSDAERDRAARFRFEPDRERWTRAHAILRCLLGAYLRREPQAIEFALGAHGKPSVLGDGIDFNLSHSAGMALFAFAIDNPVGIDVELAGRARDILAIAERVLGHDELERLRALPPSEREPEFLRSWVRHEAALKCCGDRLGARVKLDGLSLLDLDVGPAAAAAVALERSADAVCLWKFEQPALAWTERARAS